MFTVVVLVIAAVCGLAWGALLRRTRIPPIGQDIGAIVVGWILGLVLASAAVVLRLSLGTTSGGIGVVSFGFAESSLLAVVVGAPLAAVH